MNLLPLLGTRPVTKAVALGILVIVALWLGIPIGRAVSLVETHGGDRIAVPTGLLVQSVNFAAKDGVRLSGWLVPAGPNTPVIIVVPGFKADRMSTLPYARFLHAGGFNVIVFDSRGTGDSAGLFSLGAREVDDVLGAVDYAYRRYPRRSRGIGLLGVSLGAGEAIVAAATDDRVDATVADSALTDQHALVSRLDQLHAGPIDIPLAPIAELAVDRLADASVSSFRPIRSIGAISPRALLLIHSRHDGNPTTPLSGAVRLFHAARQPAFLWIAPLGGHADALAAQPLAYRRRVLSFFRRYIGERVPNGSATG